MNAILTALLPGLAQLAFWVLDKWIKKHEKDKEMVESYYKFLAMAKCNGELKVANYLAVLEARKRLRDKIIAQNT